jgi:hypothetical protein
VPGGAWGGGRGGARGTGGVAVVEVEVVVGAVFVGVVVGLLVGLDVLRVCAEDGGGGAADFDGVVGGFGDAQEDLHRADLGAGEDRGEIELHLQHGRPPEEGGARRGRAHGGGGVGF